ncbi:hypothetical protein V8E53_004040 [Lactarius tabidus]
MEQFPDDSPRLRLLIVIILGVFLSLDTTIGAGATVTASTNDEDGRPGGRTDPGRAARRGRTTAVSGGRDDGL